MFHTTDRDQPMDPDDPKDPEMEALIRAYGQSWLHRSEQALAGAGDAPVLDDLRALRDGTLSDDARRQALARQLLAGPGVLESALAVFAEPEVAEAPAGARVLAIGGLRRGLQLAAAAALLIVCAGRLASVPATRLPRAALSFTDAHGLQMRTGDGVRTGELRRILIDADADTYVALARILADGSLRVEPVDGAARTIAVDAGRETLLPLGGALAVDGPQRWLVLLSTGPLDEATLDEQFAQALRGTTEPGVVLRERRVVPRPQEP